MILAALLMAAAVLTAPTACGRQRLKLSGSSTTEGAHHHSADPLAVASSLDLLAVCLTAGMAVPAAATATAPSAPPQLAAILRRAADMLALGAAPDVAWSMPPQRGCPGAGSVWWRLLSLLRHSDPVDPHCVALLRLAKRSASSGAALADGVAQLAAAARSDVADAGRATAERASVLIAGPLALCFLPAFICLGIVPVVAGLADGILGPGLV